MAKKKETRGRKKDKSNVLEVKFKERPTDKEREEMLSLFKDFNTKKVTRLMEIFMTGTAEGACIAAEKRLSDLMAIECGVDDELEPEDVVLDVRAVKDSAGAIA